MFPFGRLADTQVHKWLNDVRIDPQAMVALQPLEESILSSNPVRLKLSSIAARVGWYLIKTSLKDPSGGAAFG